MKNLLKTIKKQRLIHINYSDWYKDAHNLWATKGTVRDDSGKILLQFYYIPTRFGAIVRAVEEKNQYFISKLEGLDKADAFISEYGSLTNAYSITDFINKYIN